MQAANATIPTSKLSEFAQLGQDLSSFVSKLKNLARITYSPTHVQSSRRFNSREEADAYELGFHLFPAKPGNANTANCRAARLGYQDAELANSHAIKH